MTRVYLSLGSNIGQREQHLAKAINALEEKTKVTNKSQIYESEPWGETDQQWFLNLCLEIETDLPPEKLYELIEEIETTLKKEKTTKYGPRTIDIDILFYDELILNNEPLSINHYPLTIPHPRLTERQFVLLPLKEIAPSLVHPIDKKTITELQSECSDTSIVRLWTQNNSEN